MIKYLKFSATFPSTGKTLAGEHDFTTGMTAITGANERGKSLRLELIRYALFGTKALRAPSSEYQKLTAELEFTIRDRSYRVVRHANRAELYQDGAQIVSGTKPVNDHIIGLFGYDLSVFDVAHCVQQGDVEALSNMRPSDRQGMVEQTVGLTIIDDVIDEMAGEAGDLRATVKALEDTLGVEPTEPERPEEFYDSKFLSKQIFELETKVAELNKLRGFLSIPTPEEPQQPIDPIPELSLEELEKLNSTYTEYLKLRRELDSLEMPLYDEDELQDLEDLVVKHKEWKAWNDDKAKLPDLKYNRSDLDTWFDQWDTNDQIAERDQILDLFESHKVTCPECQHQFTPNGEYDVSRYDHLPTLKFDIPLTRVQILREMGKYDLWTEFNKREIPERVPELAVSEREIWTHRDRLKNRERAEELSLKISELGEMADVYNLIVPKKIYLAANERYALDQERWLTHIKAKDDASARIIAFDGVETDLKAWKEINYWCAKYEVEYDVWQRDVAGYADRKLKLDSSKAALDLHNEIRKALKELKTKIKTYLMPSLNRVASSLLNQMTSGERYSIEVDEQFEVKVDGQPLSTLSGSGKAVANLAIRIALGRVLTHSVFSVFLGDEIDASMDASRAEYTTDCLRGLSAEISQIILVSHKDLETDHKITL